MTKRENALEALHGNKPESVPCYFDAVQIVPCSLAMEAPPLGKGPGYDGFGVHQTPTESAGGMFTPTAGMEILSLDDIDDWEDIINFRIMTNIQMPTGKKLPLQMQLLWDCSRMHTYRICFLQRAYLNVCTC